MIQFFFDHGLRGCFGSFAFESFVAGILVGTFFNENTLEYLLKCLVARSFWEKLRKVASYHKLKK
jgi:hypothetical protein